MLCKDIEHKLSAYLEDALSPQEKTLIEEHLASCPQCSKSIESLKKTEKLVREMEEVEPPPWFTQRVMARVRGEAKQKEGFFRKLFYPLHVKIPIQALTAVLIAVLAVQIYRVGEPEMKVIVAPPATVFESGKEHAPSAPQKSPEFAPAPSGKEKAVPRGGAKKDRDMQVSSPPVSSNELIRREKMPIPHEAETPAQKSMVVAKKRGDLQDKGEEAMHTAFSAKAQEAPKATRAPAPEYKRAERGDYASTAREKGAYEGAPTAPQLMGAVAIKPVRIGVAVHVKDLHDAVREAETQLGKSGARKIQRQSRNEKEVLTAVINDQRLRELMEKLKSIGEIEEKGIPADIRGRDISITIELFSDR
jgi:hypothetical protein